jgi:CheY-like chemotaxis protein
MTKSAKKTKTRVLCVDGFRAGHDTLSLILEGYDYVVTSAHSAEEALRLARANQYDLFILDSWLPEGAEYELCRQIRAFDPHTPVLFYSMRDEDPGQRQALAAGGQGHVRKPIYPKRLIQVIEGVMSLAARGVDAETA